MQWLIHLDLEEATALLFLGNTTLSCNDSFTIIESIIQMDKQTDTFKHYKLGFAKRDIITNQRHSIFDGQAKGHVQTW